MFGVSIGVLIMTLASIVVIELTDAHSPESCHLYNYTPEEVYQNKLAQWKKDKPIKEAEQ